MNLTPFTLPVKQVETLNRRDSLKSPVHKAKLIDIVDTVITASYNYKQSLTVKAKKGRSKQYILFREPGELKTGEEYCRKSAWSCTAET